jgi:hypothetical protein
MTRARQAPALGRGVAAPFIGSYLRIVTAVTSVCSAVSACTK